MNSLVKLLFEDEGATAAAATSHARVPSNPAYNPKAFGYSKERHLQSLVSETLREQSEAAQESTKALRLALRAEEISRSSLSTLRTQSEQLDRTEDTLFELNERIDQADKQAAHLRKLNRSIFLPVVGKRPQPLVDSGDPQPGLMAAADLPGLVSKSIWAGLGLEEKPPPKRPELLPRSSSLFDPNYPNPHEMLEENEEANGADTNAQAPSALRASYASATQSSMKTSKGQLVASATPDELKLSRALDAETDRNLDLMLESLAKMVNHGLAMREEADKQTLQLDRLKISADQASANLDQVHKRVAKELSRK
ncbi:hypothetical protein DFJ73DRAFT_849219 [Zopfochytrium polystomum]|nr:hypothetical protein DFJ73DRAFT_849219 [Zopfochytrium polystomum]